MSEQPVDQVKLGPQLSPKEKDLFALLQVGEGIATDDLVKLFYEDEDIPFNANKILISRLRNISAKLDFNHHMYKLCKSARNGPHAIRFWLELR